MNVIGHLLYLTFLKIKDFLKLRKETAYDGFSEMEYYKALAEAHKIIGEDKINSTDEDFFVDKLDE